MESRKEKYERLNLTDGLKLCGHYDIPEIKPVSITGIPQLIPFGDAAAEKLPDQKGVHFFIDDYRFLRLWNAPVKYTGLLKKFRCVFSPDFSLYTDYPRAMQIYNHYRKHVLAAYWQNEGVTVVPTISWSTRDSFDWCFDGEPCGGTVAISSVGTQASAESKQLFLDGYFEMLKRLRPETVIFYGSVPSECEGNIIPVGAFQDKFKEVRINGRQRRKQRQE